METCEDSLLPSILFKVYPALVTPCSASKNAIIPDGSNQSVAHTKYVHVQCYSFAQHKQ